MNEAVDGLYRTRFGRSAVFLPLIDRITHRVSTHRHRFLPNEPVQEWVRSGRCSPSEYNLIVASELLDKAHLASTVSLIRTRRWADALIAMEESKNYLGWAASLRGLIESAGDSLDGLLNVGATLAANHPSINRSLRGSVDGGFLDLSVIEKWLDHFILAGWRGKAEKDEDILKAKGNIQYVRLLEAEIPGAERLYHKLCAITHPSHASIEFLYETLPGKDGGLVLNVRADPSAISLVINEFPQAIPGAVMMACNPALITLKVLHKFKRHPKLAELKELNFSVIPAWRGIERNLASAAPRFP